MLISRRAFDLIVAEEVSSKATYEKKYTRPEWPGVQSGVTIGIGYDVGYATKAQLHADWDGVIPAAMVIALERACGVRGSSAKGLTRELRSSVDVPWDSAITVFERVLVPRWEAKLRGALPKTGKLSADCFGALVSLAYNRGPSFGNSGDRYREMRAIKEHMAAENFGKIPGELIAMRRLWPGVKGLLLRREREAAMFRDGLGSPAIVAPPAEPSKETIDEETKTARAMRNIGVGGGLVAGGKETTATVQPDKDPAPQIPSSWVYVGIGVCVMIFIAGAVMAARKAKAVKENWN